MSPSLFSIAQDPLSKTTTLSVPLWWNELQRSTCWDHHKKFFLSLPLCISLLQNFSINRTETNHFVCGLFALSACLSHASYHPFIWPITMVAHFCHKKKYNKVNCERSINEVLRKRYAKDHFSSALGYIQRYKKRKSFFV